MRWQGIAAVLAVLAVSACASKTLAPLLDKGAYVQPVRPDVVVAQVGDTIHAIARRYGVPEPDLVRENQLRPPYVVVAGQRLRLPPAQELLVQPGDTLYAISRRAGVDMASLARANALSPPYVIVAGSSLVLPAAARVGARKILTRAPAAGDGRFGWPLQGTVLARFGPQGGGVHNDGVDIAAAPGTPVRAAENGVVAYTGNQLRGLGNLLLLRHDGGWVTAYAHTEEILVGRGEVVQRGQVVARSGASGNTESPRLHFEIRDGTRAVDPLAYLGGVSVGMLAP
jgi:murein DD-endopeptidase MepM/ murein hydrolase activator NlpD